MPRFAVAHKVSIYLKSGKLIQDCDESVDPVEHSIVGCLGSGRPEGWGNVNRVS